MGKSLKHMGIEKIFHNRTPMAFARISIMEKRGPVRTEKLL